MMNVRCRWRGYECQWFSKRRLSRCLESHSRSLACRKYGGRNYCKGFSNELKAYAQTISLIHTNSDTNRLRLYETIGDLCVYQPDDEIEVTVAVTDLRLWYNDFVINAVYSLWAGAVPELFLVDGYKV